MSAIFGIVRHDGQSAREPGHRMLEAMRRYAADDEGVWSEGSALLGCRARWITPEAERERLPVYDARHRLAIAADAILDNRRELFDRLQVASAYRRGMTDSALILLAYRKWGLEAPEYLIGDFAFAIWDERKRQLFAARDLFGHRCLYYHADARRFAFCTAISPIYALQDVEKSLHEPWLAEFMAIPEMFESTDIGATPYRHIRQLPPAHVMTVADGRVRLRRYGSLEPKGTLRLRTDGEYEEAFRAVFSEAVQARLRTNREVAVTLSGGLDSGAVAGFAAPALRAEGKVLHAYSSVPPPDFVDWTPGHTAADETPYIRATAEHVGNIASHRLDFAGVCPMAGVDDWLDLLEMPYKYFENAYWLKGIHEQAGAQGAGILLTGARGNFTISWGPAVDYYAMLLRQFRWGRLLREVRLYGAGKGIGRRRLLSAAGRQAFPGIFGLFGLFGRRPPHREPDILSMLIHPDFARRTDVFARLRDSGVGSGALNVADPIALRMDKLQNLAAANKNGVLSTKLSLRYGVLERDPTCDPRVVRFCLSVPIEQYVRGGLDRALIRGATRGILPDAIRLNRRVRGIQGADWLHRTLPHWHSLVGELRRLCADPVAVGYLHTARIQAELDRFGDDPRPEDAYRPEIRMLMRSLILYRFLKRFA